MVPGSRQRKAFGASYHRHAWLVDDVGIPLLETVTHRLTRPNCPLNQINSNGAYVSLYVQTLSGPVIRV
jgi:hypothetical protein